MTHQIADQQVPHVALAKPPKGEPGWSAGERIILVNGERWGRTYIEHLSRYGTKYTFGQHFGRLITEPSDPPRKDGRENDVTVRISRRSYNKDADQRPMEVQVREKAEELVRTGKLRDPKIVKAEVDARSEQRRLADEQGEREKDERFAVEARKALGTEHDYNEFLGEELTTRIIGRIVEAMKWAQSQ